MMWQRWGLSEGEGNEHILEKLWVLCSVKKEKNIWKSLREMMMNQTDVLLQSYNLLHNNSNHLSEKPCRLAPAFQTY